MPSGGLEALRGALRGMERAAVAVSGGVDSAFLLHVAREELGTGRVTALTARSRLMAAEEMASAEAVCRAEGVRQVVVDFDPTDVEGLAANPPERCYLCKRALFGALLARCAEEGLGVLVEGTNADDADEYRPGLRALRELGVRSPLLEAGLKKADVRALSREMGLETWDKPSLACLATRFPHGDRITAEGLSRVESAERLLRKAVPGLRQARVRVHGDMARIEVGPEAMAEVLARRGEVSAGLKGLGFVFVALDLEGFRSGSMNPAGTGKGGTA